MNNRANIMYFLETHCELNQKEGGHVAYVEMVRRDIMRVVEAVARSGANVKVVRSVVRKLGERGMLDSGVVGSVEEGLKGKEERLGRELEDEKDEKELVVGVEESERKESTTEPKTQEKKTNGVSKVDKRAIEQRIEEDRERNKRLRESMWAVAGDDERELDKMWEEGSDLNSDDYVIGEEEVEERNQFARYHRAMVDT